MHRYQKNAIQNKLARKSVSAYGKTRIYSLRTSAILAFAIVTVSRLKQNKKHYLINCLLLKLYSELKKLFLMPRTHGNVFMRFCIVLL